jgi:uncharacterized membrane protein YfcA
MASREGHETHVHTHGVDPRSHAERMATWLSLACAVHCLLTPLAIGVLPLLGASVQELSPRAHLVLTVLVVASAVLGVAWGYRRHRDARFVVATAFGLVAYLLGHTFEEAWYGVALAIVGALTLAASSFLGARLGARLAHACPDPSCAH